MLRSAGAVSSALVSIMLEADLTPADCLQRTCMSNTTREEGLIYYRGAADCLYRQPGAGIPHEADDATPGQHLQAHMHQRCFKALKCSK